MNIKKLMPERIPALGAIFYSALPAKILLPYHKRVAGEISLPQNGTLLDLGTGPGILPILIAERFPGAHIIGIDLSRKMIEIANKNKARSTADKNAEFKIMNAAKLEFNNNSFDMILSTGSMHHWRQPVEVINEIYRCLKPGGEARIYDGCGEATDEDVIAGTQKIFLGFPPRCLVKRIFGIHGFSKEEYDTKVKDVVAETLFKACQFEKHGIMMCLKFHK